MRLVLSSNGLATLGGSETYLLTLGRHLQRFGHEVHLLEGPGGTGALAADAGLLSIRRPQELLDPPDRIIVQDAIVAGEAAAAWPDVPAALRRAQQHPRSADDLRGPVVGGGLRGAQRPHRHRASALSGARRIVRLSQPVDVGHFTPPGPPRAQPEVLLLFGNNQGGVALRGARGSVRRARHRGATGGGRRRPAGERSRADAAGGRHRRRVRSVHPRGDGVRPHGLRVRPLRVRWLGHRRDLRRPRVRRVQRDGGARRARPPGLPRRPRCL